MKNILALLLWLNAISVFAQSKTEGIAEGTIINLYDAFGKDTSLKKDLGVRCVAPAHCSGYLAFSIFQKEFGANYLYAGLGETILFK